MVASTDIKWYSSDNINAPQLSNKFGVLIPVLDACLVTGFSIQTVATLTAVGTTVTATFGSAHGYKQYQVIEISGATPAQYNGQHRILTVPNSNTLTFELASVPPAAVASGSLTCKLPPLGFSKEYAATGKAAYRSATGPVNYNKYLRVIDSRDPVYDSSYAKYAKVGIVEVMTDIDGMVGVQAPFDSAMPDKNWIGTGSGTGAFNGWAKWYWAFSNSAGGSLLDSGDLADSAPVADGIRAWYIVGNADTFYLLVMSHAVNRYFNVFGFGKFDSFFSEDVHNTFLAASTFYIPCGVTNSPGNRRGSYNGLQAPHRTNAIQVIRPLSGVPKPTTCSARCDVITETTSQDTRGGSGRYPFVAAPSVVGAVQYSDVFVFESTNFFRGKFPLIKWFYQQNPLPSEVIYKDGNDVFLPVTVPTDWSGTNPLGSQMFHIGSL